MVLLCNRTRKIAIWMYTILDWLLKGVIEETQQSPVQNQIALYGQNSYYLFLFLV